MNARVKEIKLRNLKRILEGLENGTTTCLDYQGEDRDWKEGERESIANDLRSDISEIEAA